ncbi:hypothetical protein FRC10_004767 [Ceratobasidium sp. 414]|nr:hypothetical protein FRC10_004767 [Ceratobasidium sp. 414]
MPVPDVASPPLPPNPSTSPRTSKSLRRVASESQPSQQQLKRTSALPLVLAQAWADETMTPRRTRKHGLPSNPRDIPTNFTRGLRPTPDSRRVKSRQIEHETIETMRSRLSGRGGVDAHWVAPNGFRGGIEAHYAAYDAAVAAEFKNDALDLAVSAASRRASFIDQPGPVSRRGSAADTLGLPEFMILDGAEPLSPRQDVPSSPHAPFEWDTPEPFRPSGSGGIRRAGLEIELARKPRPATLPNQARAEVMSVSTTGSASASGRKRLGVILDGPVVLSEMERRYGGRRL